MSSIYYPVGNCGTTEELPQHSCKPCITPELGRVRSVFLYRSSFAWVDRSLTSEWRNGILAGDVQIIKDTQGDYDGGTTTELVGFGDLETVNGGITHILNWLDPNIDDNCDFYTALAGQTEWMLGWRTQNKVWFSNEVATFTPKVPVQNDLKSYVTWNAQAKWTGDLPCPFDTPVGIFDRCIAVAA